MFMFILVGGVSIGFMISVLLVAIDIEAEICVIRKLLEERNG